MTENFNNQASHCLFIGKRNLTEVIAQDEKELKEMGGSFDEIGYRMTDITRWAEKQRSFPKDYDDKVTVLGYGMTRGMQECPFSRDCKIGEYVGWSEIARIKSKVNGRELSINSGTAHMALEHHLLEKDNEYGISARDFYHSFI